MQRLGQEKTPFQTLEGLKRRMDTGARDRNRTDTPPLGIAADFKSAVSTSFTTRAVKAGILSALAVALVFNHGGSVAREHHATPK